MLSSYSLNALAVISGLSTIVLGQTPLATITPCPECPASISQSLITVTSQYQAVSTCVAGPQCVTDATQALCSSTVSCSTYAFVSTIIPQLGGASTTLITKTDQVVDLSYVSTVATSPVACPTAAVIAARQLNGTLSVYQNGTANGTTSACNAFTTYVTDITAPFNEIGPLAILGYEGSGLCNECTPSENEKRQVVTVSSCVDAVCTVYEQTYISLSPTTVETSPVSTDAPVTSGVNTIVVTVTFTPAEPTATDAPIFTAPVTTDFAVTTSVDSDTTVPVITAIIVTFVGEPAPTVSTSAAGVAVTGATSVGSNGVFTIPITTVVTPAGPEFTSPVTTTVFVTTTVTDGPQNIQVTTTVTVTFTSTITVDPVTVIGGVTQSASSAPGTLTVTESAFTTTTTTRATSASATASVVPGVADADAIPGYEFFGCLVSTDGFADFVLDATSADMTVGLCTSDCTANGLPFSGLSGSSCYCAAAVNPLTTSDDGVCTTPCPGDPTQACGGTTVAARALLRRFIAGSLAVYEDVVLASPTSSTVSSTSAAPTADPSSDADAPAARRGLDADMEQTYHKVRDVKMRRGGMLRSAKSQKAPKLAKRNLGLKTPFGL